MKTKKIVGAMMFFAPLVYSLIYMGIKDYWWTPFVFVGFLAILIGWFFVAVKLLLDD